MISDNYTGTEHSAFNLADKIGEIDSPSPELREARDLLTALACQCSRTRGKLAKAVQALTEPSKAKRANVAAIIIEEMKD